MLRGYPVVISKHESTDYGVIFSDFPGCVTTGETLREAAEMALDAPALHVEGMVEDGEVLPEPSAPDAPLLDWLGDLPDHAVAHVLVPVEIPGRVVRVNITLTAEQLAEMRKRGETHSSRCRCLESRCRPRRIRHRRAGAGGVDQARLVKLRHTLPALANLSAILDDIAAA